jgi:hypothetical protein
VYGYAPGSKPVGFGNAGYLLGTFSSYLVLEAAVDVPAALVTAGAAGYGRALLFLHKAGKLSDAWKIVRFTRLASKGKDVGLKIKTVMSLGSMLGNIKDAEVKAARIVEKITNLPEAEAGKLGEFLSRHFAKFPDKDSVAALDKAVKAIVDSADGADNAADTVIALMRITSSEGRTMVLAADELEQAGKGMAKLKRMATELDLDRDLLGIDPADGKRLKVGDLGRGPSDDQLKKILIRANQLDEHSRQGFAKFIARTRLDGGIPDPDAFKALDRILDEPLDDVKQLLHRVNSFDGPDNVRAHQAVKRMVNLSDDQSGAKRMVKFAYQEDGPVQAALRFGDTLDDAGFAEFGKLIDDLPITDESPNLSHLSQMMNNNNLSEPRRRRTFEDLAGIRANNGGTMPNGVTTEPTQDAGLGATGLIANLADGSPGHFFEARGTKQMIDDGRISGVESMGRRWRTTVVQNPDAIDNPLGRKLIEADLLGTIGPQGRAGDQGLKIYINFKLGSADGHPAEIAGLAETFMRYGHDPQAVPFQRAAYAGDTGRPLPQAVREAIVEANHDLNEWFGTAADPVEYIYLDRIDVGGFPDP